MIVEMTTTAFLTVVTVRVIDYVMSWEAQILFLQHLALARPQMFSYSLHLHPLTLVLPLVSPRLLAHRPQTHISHLSLRRTSSHFSSLIARPIQICQL